MMMQINNDKNGEISERKSKKESVKTCNSTFKKILRLTVIVIVIDSDQTQYNLYIEINNGRM